MLSRKSLPFELGKVLITGGAGMKPKRPLKYYLKSYTAKTLKAPFMILPGNLRDRSLQWLRTTPAWKALGSSDYQNLSEIMRITFVKTVTEYLENCLSSIDHEVFLLWGKNDDATPLYQAQRMEEGIKNATLVSIENACHYAFLDQPQQFNAIAKAYFSAD
jgi:pimeloyl-ACP methyl ester carboxylesterase